MNPDREEALFVLALEKPAEKRAAFLERECGGDTALRAVVAEGRGDTAFVRPGPPRSPGSLRPAEKRRRVRLAGALQDLADFAAILAVAKRHGLSTLRSIAAEDGR